MTISLLVKSVLIAILALIGGIVLVYGAGILIPLAVAVLLWMFINALAHMFQRLWSAWFGPLRLLSLALAFLTLLAASLILAQVIVVNVSEISARAADFERSIDILVGKVADLTGLSSEKIINAVVSSPQRRATLRGHRGRRGGHCQLRWRRLCLRDLLADRATVL